MNLYVLYSSSKEDTMGHAKCRRKIMLKIPNVYALFMQYIRKNLTNNELMRFLVTPTGFKPVTF